jgi:diguanylate cyclase (GGDEF)-like protein/PAS domain S-box-containing protein
MIGERALKQLDDVLSRSPLALVVLDRQFRVSYWSKRAEQLFGYTAREVANEHSSQSPFVYREDLDTVLDVGSWQPSNETHAARLVIVKQHVRADGEARTFRWTTVDVQDHARYHMVAFAEDITDTVAAQTALVESEERFRSLFESNPETIMLFSPDGRIVAVNAAVSRFGRFPREQIVGMHYSAFLDPQDIEKHEKYLQRALAGETVAYQARAHTYHGVPIELAITTVPVMRDGRIDGVFSILRDETEQRNAQVQIERQELQLAESEARLRSLFLHNPDPVLQLELDGTMTDCNEAAERVSGLPRKVIVGSNYLDFLPRATRPPVEAAFARAAGGVPAFATFGIVNGEGRHIEVDGTIIPQYSQGRIVGIYAVFQDITERRAAERHADMQQQRIRDLYYIAASGERSEVRIVASLEMGARAFGSSVGAVVDTSIDPPNLVAIYRAPSSAPVSEARLIAAARAAIEPGESNGPVLSANGVATAIDVASAPFGALVFASSSGPPSSFSKTDADLMGLISTLIAGAMASDLSRAQLRTLAYYDTLTGLPNRVFLSEKVRDAIEVAQSRLSHAALLYIDLDGFKDVNDTLGHARGDRLLQLVADRLIEVVGIRGQVARMGGDEFVVLLGDCENSDTAREVAELVIAVLSEPFSLEGNEHFISASIGVAIYPEDGRDDQTLVKNADIAMSRAKDRGRNGYFFYNPTLEAPIHLRLSQEKLLRRALELSEFVVFYQPQLDLRSDRVVSVEALVRWNHPRSGLIAPAHFIPSAEFSGLIVPLGDWVLATAARQVRGWQGHLGRLRLAVNLSARQFHDRDLRKRVMTALEEADFPPERFEIEITESVAMADAEQSAAIVRDLAASGIRVALDDFGTGYSSLAYLRRFDLDVLKIDRSFVSGIGGSTGDETIVNTVIGMAHSLDLEVIAEGVETVEQLAFLGAHGCDAAQGYIIAPAMPAVEFESFMAARLERAIVS